MADLNALIAQGAQFRVPPPVDPMGNMPQLMQMQSMQQQNALAQYQLGAAKRTDEQQSALNALARDPNFNPNTPEGMRQAQQFGAPGYALVKSAREASLAGVTQNEAQVKLALEKQKHLAQMYRDISSRPSDANITAHAEDVEASPMYTPDEKKAVRAKTERLLAMPMADRMAELSRQGATAGELRSQVVAPGASLVAPGANTPYFTAPATPAAPGKSIGSVSPGDFTPASVAKFNVSGNYGDLVPKPVDRAAVAEPTPTITQVVDPKNSKQMLNVNARLYKGGSLGDPGVIGVAGREPGYVARDEKAAAKQTETDKSRRQVDDLVAQLGGYYDALSDEGGITSTGLRAGSNVMAGIASSGLGQATGRLFGTQAQSQRNSIVQMRPLLVQAIKNATGMSSKQMDSNVELKMMLATATDPTLDLEANRRALANLAALYGTGGEAAPAPSPGAPTRANAARAAGAAPTVDQLVEKYTRP